MSYFKENESVGKKLTTHEKVLKYIESQNLTASQINKLLSDAKNFNFLPEGFGKEETSEFINTLTTQEQKDLSKAIQGIGSTPYSTR